MQDFLIDYRQFLGVTFAELPVVGDHPIELILNIRGLRDHRRHVAQTGLQLTKLPVIDKTRYFRLLKNLELECL